MKIHSMHSIIMMFLSFSISCSRTCLIADPRLDNYLETPSQAFGIRETNTEVHKLNNVKNAHIYMYTR